MKSISCYSSCTQDFSRLASDSHFKLCSSSNRIATPKEQEFTMVLRIKANYGSNSAISCSRIDILGSGRTPIPIKTMSLSKAIDRDCHLQCLFDGQYYKEETEKRWEIPWPPTPYKAVDIVISVCSPDPPSWLRIFPITGDKSKNIRLIDVYLENKLMYQGEVNHSIGSVIELHDCGKGDDLAAVELEECDSPKDSFGLLPVLECLSLEFLVDDLVDRTSLEFGFRFIRFYDTAGSVLKLVPEVLIHCDNCGQCTGSPFTDETFLGNSFFPHIWSGEFLKFSKPKITVSWPGHQKIGCIEIRNASGILQNLAVRTMRIQTHGRTVWVGKLAFASGKDAEHWRANSTFAFLVGDPQIKDRILQSHSNGFRE
jgi:hypothetical protein